MKIVTPTLAQVAKYNRFDAGFFVAIDGHEVESTDVPVSVIISIMGVYTTKELKPLLPLVRGNSPVTRQAIDKAIDEYPFIALSIMSNHLKHIKEVRLQRIKKERYELKLLNKIVPVSNLGTSVLSPARIRRN